MSEPLKKVRSGERLRIPASTYNAFVDAAQAHRNRQGIQSRTGRDVAPDGTILVRNDTGVDQSQFAILGLSGPLFEPTNLQAFKNHPRIVKGIAPATGTHDNKFVVLAQPIAAGKMGRAIISGVYLAKVNVTNADHDYATITNAQTGYFTSAASGPVQILWKETGTGEKWAQIIVRGTASGGANRRAKTQEAGQSDGKVSVKLLDAAGTETGSAFDVYAFPDKATNDMGNYWPAITSGQTVVVAQIDDDWFLINPTLFTFTSIDVQTNYQVDGANSKLQKKTRSTVKVLSSGSESAWTDVHTGDTCS